jgi:hypothetical protein
VFVVHCTWRRRRTVRSPMARDGREAFQSAISLYVLVQIKECDICQEVKSLFHRQRSTSLIAKWCMWVGVYVV